MQPPIACHILYVAKAGAVLSANTTLVSAETNENLDIRKHI
jgi:hypothetical protein